MYSESYLSELRENTYDCSAYAGKTFLISGASGMIASYLIDLLMEKCPSCRIIALGRDEKKMRSRFESRIESSNFAFYKTDITKPLSIPERADYVIHAASNTHPLAYATDPIGTITANVVGLQNLLDYSVENGIERFVFLSSVEVYGENRGDVDAFEEDYCGYINCNTLRAGYPESKRVGEALCQAYIKQKGLDVVIPRLARIFGPTLLPTDTKALSQFLHKGVAGEDIVLKSAGTQYFSYLYVSDVVTGILTCLERGNCGEAYNLADEKCNITLRELAQCIADIAGTKVVFEIPDAQEKAGYSTATKAIMRADKAHRLGWKASVGMTQGIAQTMLQLKADETRID